MLLHYYIDMPCANDWDSNAVTIIPRVVNQSEFDQYTLIVIHDLLIAI